MQKAGRKFIAGLCCLLLLLTGCGKGTDGDYFAPFGGAVEAEIAGERNGQAFSGVLRLSPKGEGVRSGTLTFYAPTGLEGTVLRRSETGEVSLTVPHANGTVEVAGAAELAPLLDILPTGAAVTAVRLDGEGRTVVEAEGVTAAFLKDGTPYRVTRGDVSITVVRWG